MPGPWRWFPLALLILPPLVLYWPFLFGGKTLYWGTALLQFWPWRRFAVEELLAGRLPLWNPYAGSGVPLLANHQSAIFYPFNVLYLLLPVERAMGVSLAVHAVLAAWAMYALLREWGISRLGGMVGGLAFSLSGYMVSRGSFLTEVSALPWLPLLWLYGGRLLSHKETAQAAPTRIGPTNVVALALVIALQFLAGHAQTWFYSLVSLALFALWETLRRLRRTRAQFPNSPSDPLSAPQSLISYSLLLAAVIWGIGLAAVQFLPTLELSLLAQRAKDAGWETYALQYSMWPWRLITLLLPDFFGNPARGNYWGYATYWEDAGSVGVLPFVLAVWAVIAWASRRSEGKRLAAQAPALDPLRHAPSMAALALFSLWMALGKNTPFYLFFFRYAPGFGSFQAPARWLGVYTAAMAALAGMGVDALRAWHTKRSQEEHSPTRRLVVFCRLGVAGGVSAAGVAIVGRFYVPSAMVTFADALIRFSVLWIGAMLALLWGLAAREIKDTPLRRADLCAFGRSRAQVVGWMAAVAILVAADLIWAGYGLNPAGDATLYEPQTGIGAALAADGPRGRTFLSAKTQDEVLYGRYLDFGDYGLAANTPAGIEHWWGLRETLLPDLGMVERLASANTFEPLIEARTRALLETVNKMPRPLADRTLGLMNVAYRLDPSPDSGLEIGPDIVHRSPTMTVTRNLHLLPRAYVVHQVRAADSPEYALAVLSARDFDPRQQVILEEAQSTDYGTPNTQHGTRNTEHATRDTRHATLLPSPPNRVTIRAVLQQPGMLVLADTAYPGWQATVDGQAVEIYRANYAYRAVALDAGAHEVVFRYRPLSLLAGALISAVAGAGALAAVLSSWRQRVALKNG